MTFQEAKDFLSATEVDGSQMSAWADLGCGDGLFSRVLSSRLQKGSIIHAIDKKSHPIFLLPTKK